MGFFGNLFGGRGKVPCVKSGPTFGLERSRRVDGGWRRKRSDSGKKRK